MTELRPESLTWTGLLGRWVEFAQTAVALPDEGEGAQWRASVPAIIQLQAVTFALAELGELAADERALGRDRATLLIRASAEELDAHWRGEPMPQGLLELRADARTALTAANYAGSVELTWHGTEALEMPDVHVPAEPRILAMMEPGTLAMPGEPVGWWVDGEASIDLGVELVATTPAVPRQVYRQTNDAGRVVRDVIRPITADPVPGLPLLVRLRDDGEACGAFVKDADTWAQQQRAAMDGLVEVVEE
jgi:hypothetical protein